VNLGGIGESGDGKENQYGYGKRGCAAAKT